MPVQRVYKQGKPIGWRWGKTGKIYPTQKQAQDQGRAIEAQTYRPKWPKSWG